MKAFSLDRRERTVALCEAGELKRVEIARLLDVSTNWLRKLFRQRRRLGHLVPLARGGGRRALLSEMEPGGATSSLGRTARLSTRNNVAVEAAIYARGAFLLFLPRYSPDINPIEGAWSQAQSLPAKGGRPHRRAA